MVQAAGTTKWSNLIRNMGGLSLSMEGSEVWKDSLQKKFDHLGLGGLRAAGKIIINSTENKLGTRYKMHKTPHEANVTPTVGPRLTSVSSNHTTHSIKQRYYTYGTSTTHSQTTFSLGLYIYSHISHSSQSYGQQ